MKYAIRILPGHLDLIQVLNGGERIESRDEDVDRVNPGYRYFIFEVEDPTHTTGHDIKYEDDLYEDGYLKEEMVIFQ